MQKAHKKFSDENCNGSDFSIWNEIVKDRINDIISIPEDFSSNTPESSNENSSHYKSSCTDLSVVHNIVRKRTNN